MKTGSAFITISLVAAFFLCWAGNSYASTIYVTVGATDDETDSDGNCSLREAIISANTDTAMDTCPPGSGADEIVIPIGTYTLSIAGTDEDEAATGDLDITDDLTITGGGADKTIIDGGGIDRVLQTVGDVQLTLNDLTITGGNLLSASAQDGGGISIGYSNGESPKVEINNVIISGNKVPDNGGGVRIAQYAEVTINNSTIADNVAAMYGTDGGGGGIEVLQYGKLTLVNSTISGNSAHFGAGIEIIQVATVSLINSTVSGNLGTSSGSRSPGGAIHTSATTPVGLYNTTVAGNTIGIDGSSTATFDLYDSLIADNTDGDCGGSTVIDTLAYSIIEDTTDCTVSSGTPITGDPSLGALGNNGGSTKTQALNKGSIAIDAGDPSGCVDADGVVLNNDQRGSGSLRSIDGNGDGKSVCDMGAYEAPKVLSTSPTTKPKRIFSPLIKK